MAKAHFDFRGVDVHVHFLVWHIQKQQHHWENARGHDIAISLADGVQQQAVAHQPPVHENVNAVAIAALHFGARRESTDAKRGRALFGSRGGSVIALRTAASVTGISVSSSSAWRPKI
jgi:hypothetical protein